MRDIELSNRDDVDLADLFSKITGCGDRYASNGFHYRFTLDGEFVGGIILEPVIWLGGDVKVLSDASYWVIVPRFAMVAGHERELAYFFRLLYKERGLPFAYPVTLACKAADNRAGIFLERIGFRPSPLPGYLMFAAKSVHDLPLCSRSRDSATAPDY